MTRFAYPVDLSRDEDGRMVVLFPDLPGAVTDGADETEALSEAADCLDEALAGALARREAIPEPSPAHGRPVIVAGVLMAAKAALHTAMRADGISNAELARRLNRAENEVRRMLDPDHATKIARLEEGLAALGRRAVLEVRDAA